MSVCVISRDKNKEIQEVYAPNGKPSILFRDAVEHIGNNTKEGKDEAIKVWARAYTPSFIKKFGNWELLSEAKQFIDKVTGLYQYVIKDNLQHALFEAAVQANSSPSEKKGAIMSFGKELVDIAQKLFPEAKVGDTYNPAITVTVDENGEPIIDHVLNNKEKLDGAKKVHLPELDKMAPTDLAERLSKKMGIPFEFDSSISSLGKFENGKVIINPTKMAADTVLHEFTHPFVEAIRKTNPNLFKNLASRAGDFTYNGVILKDFVKQQYPDLDENSVEFQGELITTAIALEGIKEGSINENNRKKFTEWFKTILRKIAEYLNSVINDSSVVIKPEDLSAHMTIKDLADLMRLNNQIDTDSVSGDFKANQNASATETPESWGSKVAIDFFEQQQNSIKLEEDGDVSYYTNGTIDPATGQLKRFTRLTEYTHATFRNSKKKFDPEAWLDDKTSEVFARANASNTERIKYLNFENPMSFDEIKAEIKKGYEKSRITGKIMHKMIEGYLKHSDIHHFAEDIEKMRVEGGLAEHELLWFDENWVKQMLSKIGINTNEFGNTAIEFRDNIASELMMVNESLGLGTANDGFIEHSDGSISLMDYKTGSKFLSDENSGKHMLYTNGLASPVYDTKLDRAKIELVMRMVIAKMNKPDLKVRDLKVVYISRYYGTEVRYVNVQQFLDYIDNNMRITIQELEKSVKKDPSLKDKLEQKKKEYKAMKDAKVFDFYQYQGENKIFEQDADLRTITDPKKKIEFLKNRVATEARHSLIKDREDSVSKDALRKIKDSLFAVLNSYKSVHVTDVRAEGGKDISWFASKVMGLRDQANAFLQSISQMFEEATDKSNRKINELLGEQSEFRKADRALYKEYFERTGKSQIGGAVTFSYSDHDRPLSEQNGVFDFMYTWRNVGGENKRVGAVYTEEDFRNGKITEAQWNYYKASKKVLKEVYEAVRNKVAYYTPSGKAVTYGEEYKKADQGYNFEAFQESFIPTIPFQNAEEIIEKNYLTGNLSPVKVTKEFFENYKDRYDLAVINENRFNIGMPLKYMSSDFLENDDHSYNVSRAVDVFASHMIRKYELDDVYDVGMSTIVAMSDPNDPAMRDSKGRLHLENSIFTLQSFLNQNIKEERRKTLSYWGKKNVNANKRTDMILDNIGGFISKNAFWFAPVTATFNGLYGLITNGREALIGSMSKRLFGEDNAVSLSHILRASAISGSHQFTNFTKQGNIKRQFSEDWEGTYYKDKVNFMMKMFRLSNKNYAYADDSLMLAVHNRIAIGDNAYVAQGLGEDLSNETLVIASLLAMKVAVKSVDSNGKEVTKYLKKDGTYTLDKNDKDIQNMWDAYQMNEQTGEYEYTGPTRFKDQHGEDVKGLSTLESLRIKTYLERMYGAYSPEQRTHLERYGLGRMAMKFRKFWITNVRENFTVNHYQQYVGEYKMLFEADGVTPKLKDGQPMYAWKAEHTKARIKVVQSLLGSFMGMKGGKPWSKMSVDEKKQATRLMFQLAFLGFSIAIAMGGVFPPEDKDKAYVKRTQRLVEDLAAIHPMDLLRGTTTIDSYPTQLYKAANATFTFLGALATDDIVQSGPYKGDYKGWNTVEDFIPVYHSANQTVKLVTGQ